MLTSNIELGANYLGYLSIIGVATIAYPALSGIYGRKGDRQRIFFNQLVRWGLIIALGSALSHGLLMTQQENIDFYDLKTYWMYGEGLLTLNLIIFLAFNFSDLKSDLKKIVYLIYALLFLLGCHLAGAIAHLGLVN